MSEDYTKEDEGRVVTSPEEALRAHHLATADPEPERDGLLTGPAHEEKYGLERAEASKAAWRGVGVHPTENRALTPGEDGYANLRGATLETTEQPAAPENTLAPKPVQVQE